MLTIAQLQAIYPALPDTWLAIRYEAISQLEPSRQDEAMLWLGVEEWFFHLNLYKPEEIMRVSKWLKLNTASRRVLILNYHRVACPDPKQNEVPSILPSTGETTKITRDEVGRTETIITLNLNTLLGRAARAITGNQYAEEKSPG